MATIANEFIEQIYDGVTNSGSFDQAIATLGQQLGAKASLVFAYSEKGPEAWSVHGMDPSVFAAYEAHYHHFDLYKDALTASGVLQPGFLFTEQTLVTPEAMRRSPLVQELLQPNGLGPILGGPAHVCASGPLVELAFYRVPAAEPFGRAEMRLLRAVTPHLRRACRLRLRIGDRSGHPIWTEAVLNGLSWGVVLLDEAGRIVMENREASRILQLGDGLCRQSGHLHASGPEEAHRLNAAIGDPRRQHVRGGDLRVARTSGSPPFLVTVIPIPRRDVSTAGAPRVRTAVHLLDPLARPQHDRGRLAAMFGMSGAESAVALELTRGLSLAQIADQQGVAISTIRSQLLALFAKTGTNRQSHLVALVSRALNLPRADLS